MGIMGYQSGLCKGVVYSIGDLVHISKLPPVAWFRLLRIVIWQWTIRNCATWHGGTKSEAKPTT